MKDGLTFAADEFVIVPAEVINIILASDQAPSLDCVFCGGIRSFGGKPCPCCSEPRS